MAENKVILTFKNDISSLAGYDYGVDIYDEQVRGKLSIKNDFEIVFPEHIQGIASSFVQGFFSEIVGEIGLLQTEKRAKIQASSQELADSVIAKLE